MEIRVDFKASLPFKIKKKAKYYVSYCPILDVWTQGEPSKKALENLAEALRLFLMSCYERGTGLKFQDLAEEYVTWLRDIKRIKTWRTTEDRLAIIGKLWRNVDIKLIGKDHFTQLDSWLRENKRSEASINRCLKLLRAII